NPSLLQKPGYTSPTFACSHAGSQELDIKPFFLIQALRGKTPLSLSPKLIVILDRDHRAHFCRRRSILDRFVKNKIRTSIHP
ncbi:hypothetical protein, partial [Mesorhizobium comanense]|uniref:hypothetical protein n=1 Tax=Mesorhizobium comanense TaxID=2502215 RepID=UPI001AEEECE3